jgi:hypothetical protein
MTTIGADNAGIIYLYRITSSAFQQDAYNSYGILKNVFEIISTNIPPLTGNNCTTLPS